MKTICLITFRPKHFYCDFLEKFKNYKIVIIVDDNADSNRLKLKDFQSKYKNITFVRVNNKDCDLAGYSNVNNIGIKKRISGWDKALYYFGKINLDSDFVWFLEDDVFFYDENTLLDIDNQYINDDVLSNKIHDSVKNLNHWSSIKFNYEKPYYRGMMCAVRVSNNLMKSINNYATENKKLEFLEALFPTIAKKNDLIVTNPVEFHLVKYRYNCKELSQELFKNILYHPVKFSEDHFRIREYLKNKK